jgi:hypothetical protein
MLRVRIAGLAEHGGGRGEGAAVETRAAIAIARRDRVVSSSTAVVRPPLGCDRGLGVCFDIQAR